MEAGGDDGGVVAEKRVAGPQILSEIAEMPVLEAASGAVHDKQSRGVALPRGRLGDQARGERIVEEVGFHVVPPADVSRLVSGGECRQT